MTDDTIRTEAIARYGFFPLVAADAVTVRQAGVTAAFCGGDMTMEQGGGQFAVAAGNLSITQGGSNAIVAGGDVEIIQGGAAVLAARAATVRQGLVGAVVAGNVELEESRVLLTTPQAAALGAAFGTVLFALSRILQRR